MLTWRKVSGNNTFLLPCHSLKMFVSNKTGTQMYVRFIGIIRADVIFSDADPTDDDVL